MEDISKVVKYLEDSDLLLKGVTETVQNRVKDQKGRFLRMLLGILGASLLGNILTGQGINRAGEGIVRVDYGKQQNGFLMPPHLLTNFEIQKYHQIDPRLNGVYSRDNLPKIKDGGYVINLDEYTDIGTHRVALCVHNNDVTYCGSFVVEHIPKEIKAFTDRSLSIATNIFRTEAYDSIMCGYFCIGFIDFIVTGKTVTEFTNIFSPNKF